MYFLIKKLEKRFIRAFMRYKRQLTKVLQINKINDP